MYSPGVYSLGGGVGSSWLQCKGSATIGNSTQAIKPFTHENEYFVTVSERMAQGQLCSRIGNQCFCLALSMDMENPP